jgi:hypothetical protein
MKPLIIEPVFRKTLTKLLRHRFMLVEKDLMLDYIMKHISKSTRGAITTPSAINLELITKPSIWILTLLSFFNKRVFEYHFAGNPQKIMYTELFSDGVSMTKIILEACDRIYYENKHTHLFILDLIRIKQLSTPYIANSFRSLEGFISHVEYWFQTKNLTVLSGYNSHMKRNLRRHILTPERREKYRMYFNQNYPLEIGDGRFCFITPREMRSFDPYTLTDLHLLINNESLDDFLEKSNEEKYKSLLDQLFYSSPNTVTEIVTETVKDDRSVDNILYMENGTSIDDKPDIFTESFLDIDIDIFGDIDAILNGMERIERA